MASTNALLMGESLKECPQSQVPFLPATNSLKELRETLGTH